MPRQTASIWKFFDVITVKDERKRRCLKCKDLLEVPKDSSTSNMIKHLQKKGHAEELKVYESGNDEQSTAPKITSFFGQKQHVDDKQRAMDEELVKIMVRQNASMYFFDDEDVQSRTKKAYPDLQVYGRRHFVREVIPQMADSIKRRIVQQIGSGYFSITSDGWQKPSKFPALLSVTTHTVSENFERLDNVLATIPMAKEHTGEEIANLIEQCMQNNGLEMEKLVAMVRDDAKNMQKSCRLLHINSFQCSAHFYHLVVTDALKYNNEIVNLILKVRQWVGGTHRSALADLLKKNQASEDIAQNRIPMDVPTRWNSTWRMLVRFADNKNALLKVEEQLLETDSTRKPANISQNDWTKLKRLAASLKPLEKEDFVMIKELCKLLKAFYVETCRLSTEQSTASTYLPTVRRMHEHLVKMQLKSPAVQLVKECLIGNLKERKKVVEQNKLLKLSLLIDPRFAFDEDYLLSYEWDYLEDELVELIVKSKKEDNLAVEVHANVLVENTLDGMGVSDDENKMDVDDIWASKTNKVASVAAESERELKAAIKAELSHYRHNSDRPTRDEDIFAWWKKNKERFPLIAKGARILLSIPATSVSSERTFSIAGLLYANSLRNRLSGKTAEMLILIKANLKKLQLAPSTQPDADDLKDGEEKSEGEKDDV